MQPREIILESLHHRRPPTVPYTLSFEGDVAERLDVYYGGPEWRQRLTQFMAHVRAVDTDYKEQMDDVLATLTEREKKVLRLRFGIGDGYPRTLEEVGAVFKVTRERVRQIEAKALRKLRHPTRSRKLKNFLAMGIGE